MRVEVAPYWNVNEQMSDEDMKSSKVEVAPYWNVNMDVFVVVKLCGKSRSSSILECKLMSLHMGEVYYNGRSSSILECKLVYKVNMTY